MTEQSPYEAATHYDRVTEAWGLLLGEDLHYGVFANGSESLEFATQALTELMIGAADLSPGLKVLDVGCGTGRPACQLAERFGVDVLGITTSPVGREAAASRAAALGLGDRARFELRDGTANDLEDESFDRIWVMESSHLMADRDALVSECSRVLRPGGTIVLCDIVRHREIPFVELRERARDFAVLRAAFGNARMDRIDDYLGRFVQSGLALDSVVDLTAPSLPTFDRWRENADQNGAEVSRLLGRQGLADFVESTRILEGLWRDGTFGYALLSARLA